MQEIRECGWAIERNLTTKSVPEYLIVMAVHSNSPASCTGYFAWSESHFDALRFCREHDAILVVGALRALSDKVLHSDTLVGMRTGDNAPNVVEHVWIRAKQDAPIEPEPTYSDIEQDSANEHMYARDGKLYFNRREGDKERRKGFDEKILFVHERTGPPDRRGKANVDEVLRNALRLRRRGDPDRRAQPEPAGDDVREQAFPSWRVAVDWAHDYGLHNLVTAGSIKMLARRIAKFREEGEREVWGKAIAAIEKLCPNEIDVHDMHLLTETLEAARDTEAAKRERAKSE